MWFCYRGSNDFRDGADSYPLGYAWSENLLDRTRQDELAGIAVSPDGWDSKMLAYPIAESPNVIRQQTVVVERSWSPWLQDRFLVQVKNAFRAVSVQIDKGYQAQIVFHPAGEVDPDPIVQDQRSRTLGVGIHPPALARGLEDPASFNPSHKCRARLTGQS
jgi:hypothetical protein